MRWGMPKQKRHCAAYGGISHQVIIVQKHKDFVIDVGQVIYQHRTMVCACTREVSSIRPICASPGQSVGAEFLLVVLHQAMRQQDPPGRGVPVPADIPRRQWPDPCCQRSAPVSDPAPRGTEGSNPSPSSGESGTNRAAAGDGMAQRAEEIGLTHSVYLTPRGNERQGPTTELAVPRDRWFESGSLQGRVRNEPSRRRTPAPQRQRGAAPPCEPGSSQSRRRHAVGRSAGHRAFAMQRELRRIG